MNLERTFFSLRTTAVLFGILILLLVMNVLIPQERIIGTEAMEKLSSRNLLLHFMLEDARLKDIPTSPVLIGILCVVYIQMVLVLWKLTASTYRRVRAMPSHWERWKNMRFDADVREILRRAAEAGFRFQHLSDKVWWGVRNRYSPFAFFVLHGSFLLLFAGGSLIYYTRFVTRLNLVQGDTVSFSLHGPQQILRKPVVIPNQQPFSIQLTEVEARREKGEPVALRVGLRFSSGSTSSAADASVNHPADFDGFQFLPVHADQALTFRLYDSAGYPIDSVVILANCQSAEKTAAAIGKACKILIRCGETRAGSFHCGNEQKSFILNEGEFVPTNSFILQLASVQPWVSFLVIYEDGEALLIAGFLLGIAGLIIRFLFPRQEVVVTNEQLHYRGEFFLHYLGERLQKLGSDLS